MKVTMIGHTTNPEIVCGQAAWLCTHPEPKFDIGYTEACNLCAKVIGYGHYSIAEHASFTFVITGVSRALSHQLVRHRLASYSQQSQRYVKVPDDCLNSHVWPESIMDADLEVKIKYKDALKTCMETYQELLDEGVPAEDARMVLPNAQHTSIVMTMNARGWREFLSKRLCKTVQWEIREMATEIHKQLKRKSPALFQNCGPDCKNCKERNPCK